MTWLAIGVLFVLFIILWVKVSGLTPSAPDDGDLRAWATKAATWMNGHYNRHMKYHEDWLIAPEDGGEGGPPPFP